MSKATSITLHKSRAAFEALGRTIWSGVLMALPLCGLVLFFQMTQPAKVTNARFVATRIASAPGVGDLTADGATKPWLTRSRPMVARFEGVSAERRPDKVDRASLALTASDAERVLSRAPFGSLKPGFYTEFLTPGRRRIALLVVSREPMFDRVIPDNARLMNLTPASMANLMAFVWGNWLYKVEIEDKGVEPDAVVQKVL